MRKFFEIGGIFAAVTLIAFGTASSSSRSSAPTT